MLVRRYILIALIIIISGGIYFSLTYERPVEEKTLPESSVEEGSERPDEARPADQFRDIKLVLFSREEPEGGDEPLSWELVSNRVDRFTGNGLLKLSTVSIRAVGKGDEEIYSIAAGEGSYSEDRGRLELTGPVKLTREDLEIELGRLQWEEESNLISARGGVRIQSSLFTLTGSSLTAEPDLRRITVSGDGEKQAYFNWTGGG